MAFSKYIIITFFIFVFFYSISVYKDFGLSIDEPIQSFHLKVQVRKYYQLVNSLYNAPKTIQDAPKLENYEYKFYGTAVQYPLVILEYFDQKFTNEDPIYWEYRHLYTRLIFFISGIAFYLLLSKNTRSKLIAITCIFAYYFSPRINADSYYNIKDLLFMSILTISIYYLFRYFNKQNLLNTLLLSFFIALSTNLRFIAILIPIYLLYWYINNYKTNIRANTKNFILVSALSIVFFILLSPTLWNDTVQNFILTLQKFSNYTDLKSDLLFMGKIYNVASIPIYYLPVWIGITTPIGIIVLSIFGLTEMIINFRYNLLKNSNNIYLFAVFFVISISLGILIKRPVLYDGWRHLYFLHPFIIIFMLYGLNHITRFSVKIFYLVIIIFYLSLIPTFIWMYKNHPYYNVYFNILAGHDWENKYERDYWRLSNVAAMKYLSKHAKDNNYIAEVSTKHSYPISKVMLTTDEKKYINIVPNDDADYIIADYRTIIGDYPHRYFGNYKEFYSITVDGKKIITIFKKMQE